MRVGAAIDVTAPPDAIWAFVDDPSRYLHFMAGITRWEVVSDDASGLGARYRMLMHVGSAEIGGLVEVVEHTPGRDLAWTSVVGIDQRGRWRLRETRRDGVTRVELRLSYGVAGSGPFGWIAERVAAPTVRGHLRRSLQQLKRQVEHEQLRSAAAARRAARVA
ncbi:MAG TPA: SRPBCC family protein [Baekduia sp.]|uniref:SRPBCC family protein n=1 Tax=Baekduia sp. TaxID=2600305 RepID=UPI002D77C288|nr:SRPBCC family protein [Baekduia sp.]HET6506850.1 SRPBCC family protein [Baekduia sp.]